MARLPAQQTSFIIAKTAAARELQVVAVAGGWPCRFQHSAHVGSFRSLQHVPPETSGPLPSQATVSPAGGAAGGAELRARILWEPRWKARKATVSAAWSTSSSEQFSSSMKTTAPSAVTPRESRTSAES